MAASTITVTLNALALKWAGLLRAETQMAKASGIAVAATA
jgi:hypothetical protein